MLAAAVAAAVVLAPASPRERACYRPVEWNLSHKVFGPLCYATAPR